ncbi:MAG: glycosyltransferase family 4 protein [Candidatus Omnitrophota bacterium]
MKIAIIAPPWIPVPPTQYGGIEIVIYNLVEGLHELGHEVLLFALGDSKVSCKLYPYLESYFRFGMDSPPDQKAFVSELALKYAYAQAGYEKVDIIHDHSMFNSHVNVPTLHTLYSTACEGSVKQLEELSASPKNYFVAVSRKQKERYLTLHREFNLVDVIHHGIDVKTIEWSDKKEDYCLCVGRASWEKGLDVVARVAAKARTGLVMAIKMVEDEEKEFFKKEIQPWIDKYPKDLLLQVVHEVPRATMFDLFRRAKCTLFTSQWEQPFGMVMIESMASGTPVIAFRRGGASEIIVDGKTGFVVNSEEEMIEAIGKIDQIDPADCRRHAEENFSRERMVKSYLENYKKILGTE